MFALFNQCPDNTVQTGIGKVDPARKFKCTTAARAETIVHEKIGSFSKQCPSLGTLTCRAKTTRIPLQCKVLCKFFEISFCLIHFINFINFYSIQNEFQWEAKKVKKSFKENEIQVFLNMFLEIEFYFRYSTVVFICIDIHIYICVHICVARIV